MPLSVPFGDRLSPGGGDPAVGVVDQVYGLVPPLAVNVKVYGDCTVAVGKAELLVIVRGDCAQAFQPIVTTQITRAYFNTGNNPPVYKIFLVNRP